MAVFIWQALRHLVGWSSLPFPTLMHWFPKRDAPEVLRALGGIAVEQVSLPKTLLQLTDRRGRPDLGMRYRHIAESLGRGETLSQALFAEGLITPLQKDAIAAGERGGHLQFVLFSLADAIEQREFRRGAYWAELLKPFAIVTCGIATGFVVIALFLPVIKLLNDLS
jgi:type IV pilus assembly protein PilC